MVALELARSRAGEDAAGSLDRIERKAVRLDELIGRLLLLERLEAGQPDVEAVAFDVSQLVGEVVDDASFEAAPAGREVLFESGSPVPATGYPSLLRSAVDNVIRNAIRHTPESTPVEVALAADDGGVSITVRDHGPGVPDEHLENLFEPFSRVADARERATGGAGLGLAITRRAVVIHGGSVAARNHPDGGLDVAIHLPAIQI